MIQTDDLEDDRPVFQMASWAYGADPLKVCIERETLREAWQELSEAQQRAINRYADRDTIASKDTVANRARLKVRPLLAEL